MGQGQEVHEDSEEEAEAALEPTQAAELTWEEVTSEVLDEDKDEQRQYRAPNVGETAEH